MYGRSEFEMGLETDTAVLTAYTQSQESDEFTE